MIRKLLAAQLLVVLPAIGLLAAVVTTRVERELLAAESARLRTTARAAAELASPALDPAADGALAAGLAARFASLAAGPEMRISLFGADGRLLADTDPRRLRRGEPEDRPELARARAEGEAELVRASPATGGTTSFHALRLPRSGELRGVVRVGIDREPLDARLADLRWTFLLAAGAASLLAAVVARFQARRIEGPVARLAAAADAMARGDFDGQLAPVEAEGLEALGSALSRVAATSRERIDTMLTERNRLLAILAAMVEGVVAVDGAQRIVHMNAAAARILGTQSAATGGRRVLEVSRIPEVSAILADVMREGRPRQHDLRVVVPPRDRHVELHATPLRDADGDPVGAVLMLHDVTELRRLEAIRREFVANVSHELKTPITAIRGMVETVLDDEGMDAALRRRFLGRIRDQSFRLSELVTDLLTLSRLESEGLVGEMAVLDMREPIGQSLRALAQLAEGKGIRLTAELPEEPVQVVGEAEALRLVFGNLLDNAIKYTPPGRRVTLRLSVAGRDAIAEVVDEGIGIEPKHLDRIFQRFYRVDQARARELGGTGLGLSIVRHVCIAHRGNVSVESQPGVGSTFRVRLPLA